MPSSTEPDRDASGRTLANAQAEFVAALMRPDAAVPHAVAGASAAQRVKRFNVYRNNVHAGLVAALRARFPVVERLVGGAFFQAMTLVFIDQHPPRSPILATYGGAFADFVAGFAPAADLPYLPDVARLEWARNAAYHSADDVTVDIAAVAAAPAEVLGDVRLLLHPATAIIPSPYPIVSIWRTNTHDDVVAPIGPDHAAECGLVTRPGLDVLVTGLPAACVPFLAALTRGDGLAAAAAAGGDFAAKFDLSATLAAIFAAGAVARVSVPSPDRDTGAQP